MADTVDLINLSIQKYDEQCRLNVKKRLIVPIEKTCSPQSSALKLISICLVSGIYQSFKLDQSCQVKHRPLSFVLNNPIINLPSIGFSNVTLDNKTHKKLLRIFRLFEILPISERVTSNEQSACFVENNLIEFVAQRLSNRLNLDIYIEEGELAITVNETDYLQGRIKNGRLLSTIVDWEQKLAC